jgi:hypothetical protein
MFIYRPIRRADVNNGAHCGGLLRAVKVPEAGLKTCILRFSFAILSPSAVLLKP